MSIIDQQRLSPGPSYLGVDTLTTLYSNTNLGQFWTNSVIVNGTTYFVNAYTPEWRNGDLTTYTYNESPMSKLKTIGGYDNYRFRDPISLGVNSFFNTSTDSDWNDGPNTSTYGRTILQSSTAGDQVELQIVGESFSLYGLRGNGYGTANIILDGVQVATNVSFSGIPTTTQGFLGNETNGWTFTSDDSTAGHFNNPPTTLAKILNPGGASGSASGVYYFGLVSTVTFSGNNPVTITSIAHGLSTGNLIYIGASSVVAALSNGTYVITVIGVNTFTIIFNGSGVGGTCNYSVVQDWSTFNTSDVFALDVYIPAPTNMGYVNINIDFTNGSTVFTNFAGVNWGTNLTTGLQTLYVKKSDFELTGNINWSTVYKISLKARTNANGNSSATFSNGRWLQKFTIYSGAGLNPYIDHNVKLQVVSGIVNVLSADITATKKALEMHRDQVLMGATLNNALIGVANNDANAIQRAIYSMERYRLNNQLGDRTFQNRSKFGYSGFGSTEDAYFNSTSDNIPPGYPLTTDTGFDLAMMCLTYLILQKSGSPLVTQANLNNWMTMINNLALYANTKGYNSNLYFNTYNSQLGWSLGLALAWRVTGSQQYRAWAVTMAEAMNTGSAGTNATTLLHFFKGSWNNDNDKVLILNQSCYGYEATGANTGQTTLGATLLITDNVVTLTIPQNIGITWNTIPANTVTNFYCEIDNEIIFCTNPTSITNQWSCLRGQLGSIATAHTNGTQLRRDFDIAYSNVQVNFAYAYGVVIKNDSFKNLAKMLYNAVSTLYTPSTMLLNTTGGSRNLSAQNLTGLALASVAIGSRMDGNEYPTSGVAASALSVVSTAVNQYGYFFQNDPAVYGTAAYNYIYSQFGTAYTLGVFNALLYLGYFNK